MSSRTPVAYIDLRVFSHSTEDEHKVLRAVYNILPAEFSDLVRFKRKSLKGHYGNPITLLETRIKRKDTVKAVIEKLASGLDSRGKKFLRNEIRQHLDKGNLYVRFDKQSAFQNEIKLSSDDPIHFRIHFRKSRLEEIEKTCQELGILE